MAEDVVKGGEVIQLGFVLKLSFIVGLGCGAVLMPFAAYRYLISSEIINFILVVLFTPVVNGLIALLYALIGYPLYRYLATRKMFGLSPIGIKRQ